MTGELASVDYSSVGVLARALGTIPAEVKVELRPRILEAANLIANQARQNASYSSRIPAAIYVRAGLTATAAATVGVSAARAPEARVLEFGNDSSRSTTKFRHPVFGNDVWVDQNTQPFLFRALDSKRDEAVALISEAVRAIAARHGLI